LDSVQAGQGINDDGELFTPFTTWPTPLTCFSGSGTSLILELFQATSKYRTKNKVRFAWWGAEENGLLGSKHYCSTIQPREADRILAYLNFDMVAKGYIGVGDGDGSSHGSRGPPGSEVIERIWNDYFKSKGIVVTPATLTNGSDYASFWSLLNKPFGFLHTGTGVDQDPCYHQACDTFSNPDPETITTNARVSLRRRIPTYIPRVFGGY